MVWRLPSPQNIKKRAGVGCRRNDSPRSEMFQRVGVAICPEQPTVTEGDTRQVVSLGGGVDDSGLTGQRKVAAEHLVRTAFAEESCKLLRCRHGSNAIGSGGFDAGMGPMRCRVP